ncbi:MAG: tetratricopeptide repeat protein [Cyanobacteria bacterium P01_F01_bin.150]
MTLDATEPLTLLNQTDAEALNKLLQTLELSEGATTIFAIAPDPSPAHPVVQQFQQALQTISEPFHVEPFRYSDRAFYEFLYSPVKDDAAKEDAELIGSGRRLVMVYGLDQLPTDRLAREMDQLNRGRETIAKQNLVLIFWLNKADFLDEFRSRAPDFWDWRGKVITFQTRPPLNPLLNPYLEWLIAENSYLKMGGIMQVNRQVDIFLDQIYVSLQGEWVEERSQSVREQVLTGAGRVRANLSSPGKRGEPDAPEMQFREEPTLEISAASSSRQRVTKIVDLAEAVRKHGHSVILGDPGAGKTTLLRYLVRHFAIASRDSTPTVTGGMQEDLGPTQLPILFRIADYAERLAKQPSLSLVEYLKQFYRQWEQRYPEPLAGDAVATLLLNKMAAGNCLLLLDGLDEVFDQANRAQVVQQINQLVEAYPRNKFVITSRIAGYQESALGRRFREFTITAMGDAQIEQFLQRWCLAIEEAQRPDTDADLQKRDAEREAEGIMQAIATQPGVKRFAANPLLLTILALIHRNGTQMPQRRVELYELATKTLIEDWQLGRNIAYRTRPQKTILLEKEVTELLAPLAFRIHEEKPSGLVEQTEIEAWLTPKMAELQGVEESVALELVRQFLRKVRDTTGLFVERAPGVYGFMHLTFEEYFAARYIVDHKSNQILKIIQSKLSDARWEEPILLALSFLDNYSPQQSRDLIKVLFKDLTRLADKMFPSQNFYYLTLIKSNLIKLDSKLSRQPNFRIFTDPIRFFVRMFLLGFNLSILLWIFHYIDQIFLTSHYLGRLRLALQIIQDLELNIPQRSKLIQGLIAGKVIIDCLNLSFIYKLPDSFSQYFQKNITQVEKLKEYSSSQLLKRNKKLENQELILPILEYLKSISSNLLLYENIRSSAQRLFFEFVSDYGTSLPGESTDIVESLSSVFPEKYKAVAYYQAGYAYYQRNKYAEAIAYYEQGRDLYQQLEMETNVAKQWYNLAICYRNWGKYKLALEAEQQDLALRQKLGNRSRVALAYYQLGRIYQAWGKYEEAITHHEQSRNRYQQLEKKTSVANQWFWMAACYRDWGKYGLALDAQWQVLAIRQQLDDQPRVALAYYQLGRIYQAWGKYEEAVAHYEQSRDRYQQLEKKTNVANQWVWMAGCYLAWGKYGLALEAEQQGLTIRQKLDEQANIALAYYQLGRIYQAWGKYEEAIAHYEQSRDRYQQLKKETDVAALWYWMADCYRDWGKYGLALDAEQKDLAIRQKLDDQSNIADAYFQLGCIYQAWGKYEEAIAHYKQSRDRYQQLEKETSVANQWSWMAACYRDWSKYELALDAEQKDLAIRQKLDDQPNIAGAYYQLGRIYQAWGKYEEAIAHYEQSRDRYQQLEKEADVANQWYWIADCYRDWGKYELALEAEQQDLVIRQKLDDQPNIADAYYQLGRIYHSWGKYEQAIAHYEQSRDRYQQLEKEADVANQWYWIADCYRNWGKYGLALDAQRQVLAICQKMDDQPRVALAYHQLGRIYQAWGQYEEAIAHYDQSRDRYQQLEKEANVANQWGWLSDTYRDWGKYGLALDAQQQNLAIRQKIDDQRGIANAYFQLGCIYQAWGKYEEAIAHYEQSRDRYKTLDLQQKVANQLSWLASCYRDRKDYATAIEYYQRSLERHQSVGNNESVARRFRKLSNTQRQWAKTCSSDKATALLQQAKHNLQQAIDIDTAGDYRENLAYDQISLALLSAEELRCLSASETNLSERVTQFEQSYTSGVALFTELGQVVARAEEVLEIARAYLEIPALADLDQAEALARQSLQTFQEFNRRKLEAAADKLLGEIYLKRAASGQGSATITAKQFLTDSLRLYRELTLTQKAEEVEQLLEP